MKKLEYFGHQLYKVDDYDKWKIMVIYKDYLPEGETRKIGDPTGEEQIEVNFNTKHKFVYPYISGWLYGKWTHNPKDISEFPEEVQKFCKETWTDAFKDGYKRWRETVGPWVE